MKKLLGLYLTATLVFILWAFISSAIENIVIDIEIMDFQNRGVLISEKSTSTNKYYIVKSDKKLDSPCYTSYAGKIYPGGPGDIIVSKDAAITIPVIHELLSFFTGGHAAISAFPYSDYKIRTYEHEAIEVTGFGSNITVRKQSKNEWDMLYKEYMAYRVNTSLLNRKRAFNRAISFTGEEYNYSFMFELESKKYCSDLISRSYDYVGIDLNKDNVATTVIDIMASPDTYLCYYSRVDKAGVRHNYILDDSLDNL